MAKTGEAHIDTALPPHADVKGHIDVPAGPHADTGGAHLDATPSQGSHADVTLPHIDSAVPPHTDAGHHVDTPAGPHIDQTLPPTPHG